MVSQEVSDPRVRVSGKLRFPIQRRTNPFSCNSGPTQQGLFKGQSIPRADTDPLSFSMANRLAAENSLYLRQHGENPVDWYPWGEEALRQAREEDKPLLVSIGYSSCHWCHVMAHESFENEYAARLMNENFVCIKVDREERPDIDQIYMETVQMLYGHGGWPLNVFCLPDGRPFAGGTYFPPDDRGQGLVPWPQLLIRVSDYYRRERGKLRDNAKAIVGNLTANNAPGADSSAELGGQQLLEAAHRLCQRHDDELGGFGSAPKFPPSMALNFLLALRGSAAIDERNPSFAQRIDTVVKTTLGAMAHGGIYDQIGGGFARYSVDKYWLIPHFEKMLYDNAQIIEIYTKGWLRYRDPLYRVIVEETIGWLDREMRAPNRGYYSSLDADSEGEEGKFQVWRPAEVEDLLGTVDARRFCEAYSITETGNFEGGASNPALSRSHTESRQELRPLREKLLATRAKRIPPGKDTKQLTAWNSLLIRGLSTAGFYLGRRDWLEAARGIADWIWEHLRFEGNRLRTVDYGERVRFNGYLTDYAYYAEALLSLGAKIDWVEPGASAGYIDRAIGIIDAVLEHFVDSETPGFYFVSDDHEAIVMRKKEWLDNALPAGNASLLHAFGSLYALTGEAKYGEALHSMREAYTGLVERAPEGIPHALSGIVIDAIGIVVIKMKGTYDIEALRRALSEKPWRETYLLVTDSAAQREGYQLCVGNQCMQPTRDLSEMVERI